MQVQGGSEAARGEFAKSFKGFLSLIGSGAVSGSSAKAEKEESRTRIGDGVRSESKRRE